MLLARMAPAVGQVSFIHDAEYDLICMVDSISETEQVTFFRLYSFSQNSTRDLTYDLSGSYTPTGTVGTCEDDPIQVVESCLRVWREFTDTTDAPGFDLAKKYDIGAELQLFQYFQNGKLLDSKVYDPEGAHFIDVEALHPNEYYRWANYFMPCDEFHFPEFDAMCTWGTLDTIAAGDSSVIGSLSNPQYCIGRSFSIVCDGNTEVIRVELDYGQYRDPGYTFSSNNTVYLRNYAAAYYEEWEWIQIVQIKLFNEGSSSVECTLRVREPPEKKQ